MASLTPQKIVLSNINGGQQFADGDVVTPEAINSPIQASAYAQALATNQPDVSEAGNVGTPTVSIVTASDGTPRLKFSNLKGGSGASTSTGASIRRIEQFDMEYYTASYYDVELKSFAKDYGITVIGNYYTSGCNNFAPKFSVRMIDDDYANNSWENYKFFISTYDGELWASVYFIDNKTKFVVDSNRAEDLIFDIDINPNSEFVTIKISRLIRTYN